MKKVPGSVLISGLYICLEKISEFVIAEVNYYQIFICSSDRCENQIRIRNIFVNDENFRVNAPAFVTVNSDSIRNLFFAMRRKYSRFFFDCIHQKILYEKSPGISFYLGTLYFSRKSQ